ncbi:MAG: aldo/keto reductase [Verrucomicrobia bacterium]|nr:aldo/keto reductase [Verrucomicrobiota bacterium]
MKRRDFIKMAGGAAGVCALGLPNSWFVGHAAPIAETVSGMPYRVLGRTGVKVSIVGFSGLALNNEPQERCDRAVREVLDQGVNYFDVAPAYGKAEEKLGPALQGIDRSRYFLACKTKMRDAKGAREELERSLTRLKTDHFDLYQLHHIRSVEEAKQALAPGGAMETFLKAKEEGKVKWFGFSAHTTKGALEVMKGFKFDTVMFPVNFFEWMTRDFGKPVVDLANEQGAAILSIKPMYHGLWPAGVQRTRQWWYRTSEGLDEVSLTVRFALSQRGVVSCFPPSFLDLQNLAIQAAKNFTPITDAEVTKLRSMAANLISHFDKEEKDYAALHSGYPHAPHDTDPWGLV